MSHLERLIKQTVPITDEYLKASLGIWYVSSLIGNQMHNSFKKFDITPQQYNVLRILRGQYPKSININSIRERMLDKESDVSRLILRLYKSALVSKETMIEDKRNTLVSISEKGLALLEAIDNTDINKNMLLKKLSLSDIKEMNKVIDKLLSYY